MRRFILPLALTGLCLIQACSAKPNQQQFDPTPGLGVDMGLSTENRCHPKSPVIQVKNIPPETKNVHLKMLDLDFGVEIGNAKFGIKTTGHGMYFTNEDGIIPDSQIIGNQGTIPQGAVKGYQPPCSQDDTRSYQLDVRALDEKDGEIARVKTTNTVGP